MFTVNRAAGKIYATKIGAGADRIIEYTTGGSGGYTNVLPLATDASGAVYGGKGYKDDYRISTSSFDKAETGVDSTGLIPIKAGDVLWFENCNMKLTPANTSYGTMVYIYGSDKAFLQSASAANIKVRLGYTDDGTEFTSITMKSTEAWAQDDSQWAYVRFTTDGLDENSIITINEPIV